MKSYLTTAKLHSGSDIEELVLIDPDRRDEFFLYLRDAKVQEPLKAFIAISLCTGVNFTEAQTLRRCDFKLHRGTVKLQPSAKAKGRLGRLHPVACEIVDSYFKSHRLANFERLFTFSRNYVFKNLKKLFGEVGNNHSITRMSCITYMLERHASHEIAKLLGLEEATVNEYRTRIKRVRPAKRAH